jgi:hypothetical protein
LVIGAAVKRWLARRALDAVKAAYEVAHLAIRAGWSPRQATDYLRATARAAAVALGAAPAKADKYVRDAERELGHQMLLAAIGEVDEAFKNFKMPDTSRLK